jgi:multicomponent K+:H+ antiporter subunit G
LRDSLILIVGLVAVTTPIALTVLVGAARFRDTAEIVANVFERDVE